MFSRSSAPSALPVASEDFFRGPCCHDLPFPRGMLFWTDATTWVQSQWCSRACPRKSPRVGGAGSSTGGAAWWRVTRKYSPIMSPRSALLVELRLARARPCRHASKLSRPRSTVVGLTMGGRGRTGTCGAAARRRVATGRSTADLPLVTVWSGRSEGSMTYGADCAYFAPSVSATSLDIFSASSGSCLRRLPTGWLSSSAWSCTRVPDVLLAVGLEPGRSGCPRCGPLRRQRLDLLRRPVRTAVGGPESVRRPRRRTARRAGRS